MKPATPLPWHQNSHGTVCGNLGALPSITSLNGKLDRAYIVHACNAYPQLVAALRETLDFADYVANNGNAAAHDAAKTARALLTALCIRDAAQADYERIAGCPRALDEE